MASPTSDDDEITHKFRFFQVHRDGKVVLFRRSADKIPPFDDPVTGVKSKDVVVSADPPVSARIFLPKSAEPAGKLPVLLYIHGGGFCMQSPFTQKYHSFVSDVVAGADVIAVSVDYGLFPDRPIPACYDDSWAALQWVAVHEGGNGPEEWLNNHADLNRVFVAGDSAGGNITHNLLSRVGSIGLPGSKIVGAILVHPFFGGTVDDHMWMYMNPENKGLEDPRMRPAAEDLARIGCGEVLVFVAEKDELVGPGKRYVEELRKSGWSGSVEMVENIGEGHCFHLFNPDALYEKTVDLVNKFVSFLKEE
ncbi:putative carboxylesterase 13 [Morus notabilis]|uniref:Putative carboxylesterase 13 n=1 Tax=Morus notabilis TaxID=981085 RepID=W9RYD9_9ROSA|nr:probable carboxylesterase 12 [Morus notabilis]EXC17363.1 putative carboxylesterase 13 [Morus notabilis]